MATALVRARRALLIGMPFVFLLQQAFVNAEDAGIVAAKTFVRNSIDNHHVVIFSKSYCPYCKRAKGVLKEFKTTPYIVELDLREDGANIQNALYELVSRRTVPQVFVGGKHIGGSDDTIEAYESGELAELIDNVKELK